MSTVPWGTFCYNSITNEYCGLYGPSDFSNNYIVKNPNFPRINNFGCNLDYDGLNPLNQNGIAGYVGQSIRIYNQDGQIYVQ